MATILVTCFEPFGGEARNASQEAVSRLPETVDGCRLVRDVLPVCFGTAAARAGQAIDALRPGAVLCVGQAAGRSALTPERVALNLADTARPDNAGCCPVDVPIVPGGPAAYFTTLPVKAMAAVITAAGAPAAVSCSAGTYVCNDLFYRLRHGYPELPLGFLHVPALPGSGREGPSLPVEVTLRGLAAALRCVAAFLAGAER